MKMKFYAVIDIKEKDKLSGKRESKSYVYDAYGYRHNALRELRGIANKVGGKITHFEMYKNSSNKKWIMRYKD